MEYLFSCSPVTTSYFIICIFLNIMNYEFVYSFLLEQITPLYALRGDHKSVNAENDCFLLPNQHGLHIQPHFSCATILQNHYSWFFFNSYSAYWKKDLYFLTIHLDTDIIPQEKWCISVDIMLATTPK